MSRIGLIASRDELGTEARDVFDRIVGSRGTMPRPFEVLLHSPVMAEKVAELGHVIRFESHLTDADRELATLAHRTGTWVLVRLGVATSVPRDPPAITPGTIAALESDAGNLGAREATLVALVDELCETGAVSDETFRAVVDLLGTPGIVELVLTVGYYTMLGYAMSAVEAC